ncbi:MAG TPA: adenylate/guanylate cyclase domain-containing protein, partial [bacterium]|nr:adenylate/guanylate cyclase domain-containing protein [bacterium]
GGSAILAAVWNRFLIEATDVNVKVGPLFEAAVLGINLVVVSVFSSIGDGGAALAARLATFRSKLLFVGLAGAGSALILYNLGAEFGVLGHLNPPLRAGTIGFFAGSIVYGLCSAIAARLAAWFADAVAAVEALGRGDLSARMPESPRDESGALARAFNRAVADRREAQLVERAFGQYVGADILASIRQSGRGFLAAERSEATVLYADVRGFTKFSESETPEEVMRILNIYFARMVEVIAAHGGHLDKFIGDALMVTFNVPVPLAEHATRAATCGVEIQAALARLNAEEAFGAGRMLEVGIGVNTGELVAGSLGSEGKAQYTVIGDTVNIAARLTSAAKAGEVLAGERTAEAARASTHLALEPLAPLTLKGKAQPVPAWRCSRRS